MRKYVVGIAILSIVAVAVSLAFLARYTGRAQRPNTARQTLEDDGIIFVNPPRLSEAPISPDEALLAARAMARVAPAAVGRPYLLRYQPPQPGAEPRLVWVVHFTGVSVPFHDHPGHGGLYSHLVVLLEARGTLIGAMGIPDEQWTRGSQSDPFGLGTSEGQPWRTSGRVRLTGVEA